MDITFRLAGPWGPGKGANLAPSEVDNNFWSVAQAIVDLQNDPAQPVGIENISVSGTQMTITLTDGTVMGPFTLPVLTFRWRGEWQPATAYAELDVFTVTNVGIFMVLLAHVSDTTFDPAYTVGGLAAYLQLFGSADATLGGLPDVEIVGLQDRDILQWDDATEKWQNLAPGNMLYQNAENVTITGGRISGMPTPADPTDVATKAYVDSLPAGATSPDATMMSNIAGIIAPAIPNTLTDFLDYVLGAPSRGTILYRGGSGWVALPPGISGYFLQTLGPGFDPSWAVGTALAVTAIYAGTGIAASPANPIVTTGTVALADIPNRDLLANISGATAAPVPTTLTAFLDVALTTTRGTIITRTGGGWAALAPGTAGQFLKTQGAGADTVWDAPAGAGTVTSISAGTGISTGGSPITGAGTVALAAITNLNVLANISGGSAAPAPATVSQLLDSAIATTQGAVIYRSATAWVALSPGTTGQILTTGGAVANPSWQNAPITGGSIPSPRVLANITGSSATPVGVTITNLFDATLGSVRGMVIFRSNSGWSALAAGTSGQVLTTRGTTADPQWTTPGTGGASYNNGEVLGNATGSPASPVASDAARVLRASVGDGTAGQVLTSSGAGVNPVWGAISAGMTQLTGDVTAGPGAGAQAATVAAHAVSNAKLATAPAYTLKGNNTGSVADVADLTVADVQTLLAIGIPYSIGFSFVGGVLGNTQLLGMHKFPRAVSLPANLAGSVAGATANATGSTVISVDRALAASPGSFTQIGSITFAAGGAVASFATVGGTAKAMAIGDVVRLVGPSTADATLANFYATLLGVTL